MIYVYIRYPIYDVYIVTYSLYLAAQASGSEGDVGSAIVTLDGVQLQGSLRKKRRFGLYTFMAEVSVYMTCCSSVTCLV